MALAAYRPPSRGTGEMSAPRESPMVQPIRQSFNQLAHQPAL